MDNNDVRLAPILTPNTVGHLVDMPTATVYSWMRPRHNAEPLVHSRPNLKRGWPTIPVIGLSEAVAIRGLRHTMPLHKITAFAAFVRDQTGDRYALASPRYLTDGVDFYAQQDDELMEITAKQGAFSAVLAPYLDDVIAWEDDIAGTYRPPRLASQDVEIDPRFNAGRMSFTRSRVPLFAPLGSLEAGDPIETIMSGYELTRAEVELVDDHREWLLQVA